MSRTATLWARLNAIADEIARLESRPEEPPVGSVIRFNMKFGTYSSTVYHYAAIHAGDGKWYVTGPRSPKLGYNSWDELLDWMEDGTEGFLVLQEGSEFKEIKP